VSGDGIAEPDLKAYVEDMKDRLRLETGIRLVQVRGFSQHQLRVELSAEALRRYGLSAQQVANLVSSQSVDLPSGTIQASEREVLLRFTDERRTPRELAQLVIVSSESGGEVRLGQMGRITDVFALDEQKILVDGRRGAMLDVLKTRSEDALDVIALVRAFLDREAQRKPPGIELRLTQDVASIVSDRLTMLVKNGWQGLTLVFVALLLFFSARFAFWVAMGIPVAFLGALFFMSVLGFSINMLTMVGLLLALGLLMDDAIVIAENIAAHRQQGKAPLRAAVDGVLEVRQGVLSSFATTVCVFGPLAFLEGDIGKVLKVMPVVLILVLAVSLIEAFLILPNHLSHALHRVDPSRPSRFRRWFDGVLDTVRERVLGRLVDFTVRWRWLTLGMIGGVFFASAAMVAGGVLKVQAFPNVDGDVVEARLTLPQGTPLTRTEEVVTRITDALARVNEEFAPRQPGGRDLVESTVAIFGENPAAFESGPHVARIVADLLSAEERDARVAEVLERWREEVGAVAGVLALDFTEPAYGPAGRPIEIRLSGDDLGALERASADAREWFGSFPGVLDLSDDLRPGKPELRMRLREGATGLGLDARSVAAQVRTAFYGSTASEIQVGRESYEVDVRMRPEDRERITDLERLFITLPTGEQVPLPAVVHFEAGRGYSRIARVERRRTVTITGDVDTEVQNTAELLGAFEAEAIPALEAAHPSVAITVEGEAKESATTSASLVRALMIGLLGIFLLLSFQFRSYVEPLIVMLAIPACLIGVVWGHLLMGFDLTMPSIFGFISLAGVVVNDSILLVMFVKKGRAEGLEAEEAAARASRERFRAVLLTSITTVFGLVPLMFEQSLQAQFLVPLAASIVFGMLASTFLVLVGLPSLYGVLHDLGLAAKVEPGEA
jgi:multidrug efflux pump subunit AcrB